MKQIKVLVLAALVGTVAMHSTAQVTVVDSGYCGASGNNLTWKLTSDSVLSINGSGDMKDFTPYAPWCLPYLDMIKKVIIGDSVTSIGIMAFAYSRVMNTVVIGNSVKSIAASAFAECDSLTNITIPENITSINLFSFGLINLSAVNYNAINCTIEIPFGPTFGSVLGATTTLNIGSQVQTIPYRMFSDCSNLATITCHATTPPILSNSFLWVSKDIPVYVPCGTVLAYQDSAGWSEFTNFVSSIRDTTFYSAIKYCGIPYTDDNFTTPIDSAGTYCRTFAIDTNCDSVVCLLLKESPYIYIDYSASICQGSSYTDDYFTNLTKIGTYCDTLQHINGCDSVICLTLSYFPSIPITDYSAGICQDSVYTDDNFTNLTKSGKYYDTLQSANGCRDSIVCLTLICYPKINSYYSASFCIGSTYTDDNFTDLTKAGKYYDTIQSINGCYSIMELSLTVDSTYFTQITDSISTGNSYNFAGKQLTESGTYYDTLQTIHGCDSIIELTLKVTGVGIVEMPLMKYICIYPNHTNGQLIIECKDGVYIVGNIEIYSVVGQNVGAYPCGRPQTTIDISHLANGIYFLRIQTKTNTVINKIVKQ